MHRKACVKSEITSRSSDIAIIDEIIVVFPMILNMLVGKKKSFLSGFRGREFDLKILIFVIFGLKWHKFAHRG